MAKDIKNSLQFLPKRSASKELYPKLTSVIDHLTEKSSKELDDVRYKYRDPAKISQEAVQEVLKEQGFDYVANILDFVSEIDVQNILYFSGYISLYKGSRIGLETVLDLFDLEYEITEWWEGKAWVLGTEVIPARDISYNYGPDKKDMIVDEWKLVIDLLASPNIHNILDALPLVRVFAINYVYPKLVWYEFLFKGNFGTYCTGSSGAVDETVYGMLEDDFSFLLGPTTNTIVTENQFYILTEDARYVGTEG